MQPIMRLAEAVAMDWQAIIGLADEWRARQIG
jgi:hypothetical protein